MKKQDYYRKKRSVIKETWFVTVVTLIAIGLLMYPIVSTQWNNYRQQQVSNAYSHDIEELGDEQSQKIVEKAKDYNKRNAAGPIIDPWSSRVSKDNKVYQEYLSELNTLDEMSQVIIPSIDVNLPVYHGTEDATLAKGLGHLFGTALPVGGDNTHAVVTGHTGMPDATMFDNLVKMKVGDVFYVNTYGEKMKYQVDSIDVVLPEDTDSLWPVKGKDLFTLITCTPYGVNSHRLLVHGHRVPLDNSEEIEQSKSFAFHFQWWMIAFISLSFFVLFILIVWIVKTSKKIRKWNRKVDRIQTR